jgi:hypothetical protein
LHGSQLTTRVDGSDDTILDVDEPSLIAALSAVVLLLSADFGTCAAHDSTCTCSRHTRKVSC